MAAPLQAGAEFPVTPLFFSFTDGVETLTTTSASNPFTVVTDSSGAIIGWNIFLKTPTYFISTGTNPPGCAACGVGDASGDNGVSQGAQVNNNPGTWTMTTAGVPEPSSLGLLCFGILALVAFSLKKVVA